MSERRPAESEPRRAPITWSTVGERATSQPPGSSLHEIWRRKCSSSHRRRCAGSGWGLCWGRQAVDPTADAFVLLPAKRRLGHHGHPPGRRAIPARRATGPHGCRSSQAARRSWPPPGPRYRRGWGMGMKKVVTVEPLSGRSCQIKPRPRERYAVQLANAVATSYVDYIDQLETSSAGPGVATLQLESSLLTQQIKTCRPRSTPCPAESPPRAPDRAPANRMSTCWAPSGTSRIRFRSSSTTSPARSRRPNLPTARRRARRGYSDGHHPTGVAVQLPVQAGIIGFAVGLWGARSSCSRFQRGRRLAPPRRDRTCIWSPGHRVAGRTRLHESFCMARAPQRVSRVPSPSGPSGTSSTPFGAAVASVRFSGPGGLVRRRRAGPDHRSPVGTARCGVRHTDRARAEDPTRPRTVRSCILRAAFTGAEPSAEIAVLRRDRITLPTTLPSSSSHSRSSMAVGDLLHRPTR